MRIAFYTDQVYNFGGIERVLSHKMNYLTKVADLEIILITSEQRGKPPFFSISDGILKYDLNINYDRNKSYLFPTNLVKIPKHIIRLNKCLSEVRPDILIVANFGIDFYLIPFLKKSIYKVKEFHSSRHYYYKDRQRTKSPFKLFKYKINDFIESKYDKLVVLTSDEQKYYASKTEVIPNALSTYPNTGSKLENKKVITAGRIAPVKGFEILIDAWQIVHEDHSDWKLEIFGDGDPIYMDSLNDQIISRGLKEVVFLRGSTNALMQKMLEASIYVMTSKTECFPMVLLEALSCGLPVVSFDCPNGPRNILIQDKDGLLVADQDKDELVEKIETLLSNRELLLELGISGRKNVKRFLPELIMKKWIQLFEDIKDSPS